MRPSNRLYSTFFVVSLWHAVALRKKVLFGSSDARSRGVLDGTAATTTTVATAATITTSTATTTSIEIFNRIVVGESTISAARLPGRRVLQMVGSPLQYQNGRWYERRDPEYLVDGVVTYWNEPASSFIYWCFKNNFWALGPAKAFRAYKEAGTREKCLATAHSPIIRTRIPADSTEIVITDSAPGMGWKTFQDRAWLQHAEMGITLVARTCGDRAYADCYAIDGCQWNEGQSVCTLPWALFRGPPVPTDVSQGALGTCYLLAVFASVAAFHPWLIEQTFLTENGKSGAWARAPSDEVYRTQWFVAGKTVVVAVDGWVPVNMAGLPVFVGSGFQKRSATGAVVSAVVWPSILEKAWAKIHGNFKTVESGRAPESFHALTGAPVVIITHSEFEPDKIWEHMESAAKSKFPMYAGSGKENEIGIATGHAYSILGAYVVEDTRVVELYNPWSYHQYKGTRASNSEGNIGRFRVNFDEYLAAYNYFSIAKVREGYARQSRPFGKSARRLSAILDMNVHSNNPFAVMLDWPSNRLLKREGCQPLNPIISIEVVSPAGKTFAAEGTFVEGGFHADVVEGSSGIYKVNVFAQFDWSPWLEDVTISVYTDGAVDFPSDDNTTDEVKVVTLKGFSKTALNARFESRSERNFNGFETYWSAHHLIYYCAKTRKWNIVDHRAYSNMGDEKCLAFATSQSNKDILSPTLLYGWSELVGSEWKDSASAHSTRSHPSAVSLLQEFSDGAMPETCYTKVQQRLASLDNMKQIVDSPDSDDPLFPRSMSSIASPGTSCGDTAQGISNSCEMYNVWRHIRGPMQDEEPALKIEEV